MSDSASPMNLADGDDPQMQRAYAVARLNFRYFWREVVRDRSRIVPALGLAAVKAPFRDPGRRAKKPGAPDVEHMWLSDVDYDGREVSGVLLNSPNHLRSVKEGDAVRVPVADLSDWLYAIGDDAFGGFTVNLLRSRMGAAERREHDAAWGLSFGDPLKPRRVPDREHQTLTDNLAEVLRETLARQPGLLTARGLNGWTALNQEASAGGVATTRVLLAAGADRAATTDQGLTPLDLARTLGWTEVADLFAMR